MTDRLAQTPFEAPEQQQEAPCACVTPSDSGTNAGRERWYSLVMPVDPALLEILVCPACKTPVVPVHDGAGLKCGTCRRVFPVRDDIPVMLVDEATIED